MALIYIMDPMCSWCYAFQPHLKTLIGQLKPEIKVLCYMGGLAPDSDDPMPEEMQQTIQQTWMQIEARTGTHFNHDFWSRCEPRRSTYPACRAVISVEKLSPGNGMQMVEAIQKAYYLDARNPSNEDTLIDLARQIGFEPQQFKALLHSEETETTLYADLNFCKSIAVQGFPFLGLENGNSIEPLAVGYCDQDELLARAMGLGIIH